MSNLSDLFISYKIVDTPTIQIPKYSPELMVESMAVLPLDTVAAKAEKVKTRMAESPVFKWTVGNINETPYSTSPEPSTPVQLQQIVSKLETTVPAYKITGDRKSWTSQMVSAYMKAGCSELFARNLVGLDALETGWGKHVVGDHNYGNIKAGKAWKGATKSATDKREGSHSAYRSYSSIDEYVLDKLRLLRGRYGISGAETPELFADKLVAGGYATAKNYKKQVVSTINSI